MPTRGQSSLFFSNHPPDIQSYTNRHWAISSEVVLNICDGLPRYNDDLASRIAIVLEERQSYWSQQQYRGASFLTPEQTAESCPLANRDRANTFPHRPQPCSIFEKQAGRQANSWVTLISGNLIRKCRLPTTTAVDNIPIIRFLPIQGSLMPKGDGARHWQEEKCMSCLSTM